MGKRQWWSGQNGWRGSQTKDQLKQLIVFTPYGVCKVMNTRVVIPPIGLWEKSASRNKQYCSPRLLLQLDIPVFSGRKLLCAVCLPACTVPWHALHLLLKTNASGFHAAFCSPAGYGLPPWWFSSCFDGFFSFGLWPFCWWGTDLSIGICALWLHSDVSPPLFSLYFSLYEKSFPGQPGLRRCVFVMKDLIFLVIDKTMCYCHRSCIQPVTPDEKRLKGFNNFWVSCLHFQLRCIQINI